MNVFPKWGGFGLRAISPSALARMEHALATYPNEKRLLQMRDTLQNEKGQAELAKARSRDLEELRNLKAEAEKATDIKVKRSYRDRAKALAAKYADDAEVRTLLTSFDPLLNPPAAQPKPPSV